VTITEIVKAEELKKKESIKLGAWAAAYRRENGRPSLSVL